MGTSLACVTGALPMRFESHFDTQVNKTKEMLLLAEIIPDRHKFVEHRMLTREASPLSSTPLIPRLLTPN